MLLHFDSKELAYDVLNSLTISSQTWQSPCVAALEIAQRDFMVLLFWHLHNNTGKYTTKH